MERTEQGRSQDGIDTVVLTVLATFAGLLIYATVFAVLSLERVS